MCERPGRRFVVVAQSLNEEWAQKPLMERTHSEGTSNGHRKRHNTAGRHTLHVTRTHVLSQLLYCLSDNFNVFVFFFCLLKTVFMFDSNNVPMMKMAAE